MMTDTAPIHDAGELTGRIETSYHDRYRRQPFPLVKLAEMVEDLNAFDTGVPTGPTALLCRMSEEMEVHMKKEETMVFPVIRNGGGAALGARIALMRANHDDHDRDISAIRKLTNELTLPAGNCSNWGTLYRGLREFIADLRKHMRLENDVLFPQFEPGHPGDA